MAISVVNIVFFVLLLFAGEKFAGSVDRRMLAKDISEIVKKMWRVGGTALRVYITSRIQVLMKSLWRRWRIFRFGPLPRANSTLYTQSGKVRWSNQNQQKSVECFGMSGWIYTRPSNGRENSRAKSRSVSFLPVRMIGWAFSGRTSGSNTSPHKFIALKIYEQFKEFCLITLCFTWKFSFNSV